MALLLLFLCGDSYALISLGCLIAVFKSICLPYLSYLVIFIIHLYLSHLLSSSLFLVIRICGSSLNLNAFCVLGLSLLFQTRMMIMNAMR